MPNNAQPNNVVLSLLITFTLLILLGTVYILVHYRSKIKAHLSGVERFLASHAGLVLFSIARITLGLAGLGVLWATFLPGLTPFHEYANQLGLGGLIYFFIWPLLVVQIVVAFMPYSKQWIAAKPLEAWIILLTAGYMMVQLDMLALSGVYDIGVQQS